MDETRYVATINVPGYLPVDDEVHVFDNPGDAWAYLRDERERGEDDFATDGDESYSDTFYALKEKAGNAANEPRWSGALDTVYGGTPGYEGSHDLGLAYSVDVYTGPDDGENEPEPSMTWDEAYERYDEMLNEAHGPVKIGELVYDTGRVLREVDPIAYRTGFNDWTDAEGIDTDALVGPDREE